MGSMLSLIFGSTTKIIMNFYESTTFGLRVTLYNLSSNLKRNIKIRLIPMIHIGEERYYQEVENKLVDTDIILYEGFKIRSNLLRVKNRKVLAERLGLVTQAKFDLKQFKEKLVHADFDPETAKEKWNKLPLFDRLKSSIFFPLYTYFQDRTLTRAKFVKYFMKSNVDIDKSEGPMFDKKERLKKYFHYEREKVLFKQIDETINQNQTEDKHLTIVYGAGHMKSIFRYLSSKYQFNALSGEFIDVFTT